MILDTGTIVAIGIALVTSITTISIATAKIIQLEKEIRRLKIALKSERLKK